MTYFRPALDPTFGGYDRNTLTHVCNYDHFIPTKFGEYPSIGSLVKADYVSPYIYMH